MRAPDVEAVPSLGDIWSALHKGVDLEVREGEVHYLRMLAIAADDDVVSHLLLRKLRMARATNAASADSDRIFMNSFVEYRFDGGPVVFGQLVHPSPHAPSYGISVTSLPGAGLIGLAAGQTILWPDAGGTLCDLETVHVENCPGLSQWLGSEPEQGLVDV